MKQSKPSPFSARKTAIATALALATTPAMAQMMLEEVIVTAQKRAQTVQDVPSSVTAVSEEMLEKTNTRNFADLSKKCWKRPIPATSPTSARSLPAWKSPAARMVSAR
jgi:outer membrane receptor for ferrienterochelin and colicin